MTDKELENHVKMARHYGEAVAIHMIGDLAVEKALDVIEKYPVPAGKKDQFIHVILLREDLVERMQKLPIVLDIQPAFVPSDFPCVGTTGKDRLDWAYSWKKLLTKGFICGGGSDAPIEDPNPLLGIQRQPSAVRLSIEKHEGYLPDEKNLVAMRQYNYLLRVQRLLW